MTAPTTTRTHTRDTAKVAGRLQHRWHCQVCGDVGEWTQSASLSDDSGLCHVATVHPETGAVWS